MTKQVFVGYSKFFLLDIRKQQHQHTEALAKQVFVGYSKFLFLDIRSKLGVIVPLLISLRRSIEEEGSRRFEHVKETGPMKTTDVSIISVDEEGS